MLHAVVMAGGAGTRFWPESRADRPKQLLDLTGGRTMIQATVDRLEGLVPTNRVMVVTNERLAQAVGRQLPTLPPSGIVAEPCKRDTAPCIGLAAHLVSRDDPHAVMAVMPSDHVIRPEEDFRSALSWAEALVLDDPARLVTFGIRPTYPAESFGYIERGQPLENSPQPGGPPTFSVAQFREKPKASVASEYLASGRFYWNSGIFVWQARTILDLLGREKPAMADRLAAIAASVGSDDFPDVLRREFGAIEPVSIDYAVMEPAAREGRVVVVEVPFEWDDVGSWQALSRLLGTDAQGNTIAAHHLGLKTTGTIVRGPADHLIVTLGLTDCLVVHTPDATLVANKHDEEAIREVVKWLESEGNKEYL
jgi:mannose-1-phosphate guanylyltransferase